MAKKASDSNHSPYKQLTDTMLQAFKKTMENTTPPSEVARVIVEAVISDNPDLRYVVGKDAAIVLEAKKNMSDKEFENFMKQQLNLNN